MEVLQLVQEEEVMQVAEENAQLPQNPMENEGIVVNIFRFLPKADVLKLRQTSKIWASSGAITMSKRENGNVRAQLYFVKEKFAKKAVGRLNKLLARTESKRLFFPLESGSLTISTTCLQSTTNLRNTLTFQVFLRKYGHYIRSLLFQRNTIRQDDDKMFEECEKILQTCPNLSTFAFLPFQIQDEIKGPVVERQTALIWRPNTGARFLSRLGPLRLTTLAVQMVHPRYLAGIIRASPLLETLVILRAENLGRSKEAVLEDWIVFSEEMNGETTPPGLAGVSTLCLQDWNLLPNVNVPMTKLRTVKLSIREGLTKMPELPNPNPTYISATSLFPQATKVHVSMHLPSPSQNEARHFHQFLDRFPNMNTLFLDFTPEDFWVVPPHDFTRTLFSVGDYGCLTNTNLKKLYINQMKIYKATDDPDAVFPLENICERYPEVEVFHLEVGTFPARDMANGVPPPQHPLDAIFEAVQRFPKLKEFVISKLQIWSSELSTAMNRTSFLRRLDRLVINHDFPPNPRQQYNDVIGFEKNMFLIAVFLGRDIPSFQLSGFETQMDGNVQTVLQREATKLRNVTFDKYDFSKMFKDEMIICSSLASLQM